jgi:competence protein ComER
MKYGFIGAGNMGGLLLMSLLEAGAFAASDAIVSTRTPARAQQLAERFPGLTAARQNAQTARESDVLFLCIKPSDFRKVAGEIAPVLRPDQIVVSITSPISLDLLEREFPAKVAKIIPSVVNASRRGITLLMFGNRLTAEDRNLLAGLCAAVSRPVEIDESFVRVASDLTSCSPAFFAFLLERLIDAAVTETDLDRDLAERLVCETLCGTAALLESGCFSLRELQDRVSVPGGITAAALDELRRGLGDTFERVIRTTHRKFAEDVEKMERAFSLPPR